MSSSSIFSCCTHYSTADDSGQSYTAIIRNNAIKAKKANSLNSPKASLKAMSSLRNHRNLQNAVVSSQIHMVSTVDVANDMTSTIIKPVSTNIISSARFVNDKPSRLVYLSPSISKQIVRVPSIPKQKISFSYNDPGNPQNRLSLIPKLTRQPIPQRLQVKVQEEKKSQQLQTCDNEPQILKENKNKPQIIPSRMERKKSTMNKFKNPMTSSKFNLGGSKYTVLSEQQGQQQAKQQGPMKMQQSAIILNVFNPTKSLMQKWKAQPSLAQKKDKSKKF